MVECVCDAQVRVVLTSMWLYITVAELQNCATIYGLSPERHVYTTLFYVKGKVFIAQWPPVLQLR